MRKVRKTMYFQYFKLQKEHNFCKYWQKFMIFEFYPTCMEMKSYTQFKINMPMHIGENDNIDNNK